MAKLDHILAMLAPVPDEAVDAALAAALPTANSVDQSRLAQVILDRGQIDACAALIKRYDRLPPDARQRLLANLPKVAGVLRQTLNGHGRDARRTVIRLVRDAHDLRLSYLVAEQALDGPTAFRSDAVDCLLSLAHWAAGEQAAGHHEPTIEDMQHLITALIDTAQGYGHHQRSEAVEAILLLLPRRFVPLGRMVSTPEMPFAHAVRRMVADAATPAVRRSVLVLMLHSALTSCCMAALRASAHHGAMDDVLKHIHFCVCPAVGRALMRYAEPQELWPDDAGVHRLAADQTRLLPQWLGQLPFEPADQMRRLAELSQHEDTGVRLATLRRIIELSNATETAGLDDLAATFLLDADAGVARVALWHMIRRRDPRLPAMLGQLVNSRHESVRRIAGTQLAPVGFARMWQQWPVLSDEQRDAAGRAMIKIDAQFHRKLWQRLTSGDRDARLRAMSIITHLGQSGYFEKGLLEMAHGEDAHVASAAVKALGQVDTAESQDAVRKAMCHQDSRVRANAVEALPSALDETLVAKLVELWNDQEARPRANAVGLLLLQRMDKAMAALEAMLRDSRPAHRRSALWLVRASRQIELARLVAEISVSDHDVRVRAMAEEVIAELMQILQPNDAEAA